MASQLSIAGRFNPIAPPFPAIPPLVPFSKIQYFAKNIYSKIQFFSKII
uniref:Uncharacterized protein n=1 Tax=Siphoviridae sp. ctbvd11 TaxID=2825567 RepID=A0A8S5QDK2_9CAUD|nr:MAG TPA: hypothetical protein [Siphoviridae sp. ctbvd11]